MYTKATIGALLTALAFSMGANVWALDSGDACSLLTQAEVSASLGVQVAAGNSVAAKSCQWRQQAKPGAEVLIADLNGPNLDMFNGVKSTAAATRTTITPVTGMGDEAFFFYRKTGASVSEILWVRKANFAFNVRVWGRAIADGACQEFCVC